MSGMKRVAFSVDPTWGLGDQLLGLIASRMWAEHHRDHRVTYANLREVVQAYPDRLVQYAPVRGHRFDPFFLHRMKWFSPYWNYLGTYIADMGCAVPSPLRIYGRLPSLPRPKGLPRVYMVVQPFATFTKPDASAVLVDQVVNLIRERIGGWPAYCVGKKETPVSCESLDYSHLGGPLKFLAMVQHSRIVLTARSAASQIAAAYGIPTIVWSPMDGEEWNLNYPGWAHSVIPINHEEFAESVITAAKNLLENS